MNEAKAAIPLVAVRHPLIGRWETRPTIPPAARRIDRVPGRGVTAGTAGVDDRQGRDASACKGGQADLGIIAHWGDGF